MFPKAALLILVLVLCRHEARSKAACKTKEWFGDDTCPFQCHCASDTDCNKITGACPGLCHPKWFGPACQYTAATIQSSNVSWLTDNNDTTCNSQNLGTVTASLLDPIPLSWLRVVTRDAAHLEDIQISYGTGNHKFISCSSAQSAKVNDKTLDISCPTDGLVSQVRLTGKGVRGLCSLYISGGRNVALKQQTKQSSTYFDFGKSRWVSSHGVDGYVGKSDGGDEEMGNKCTHTRDKKGWWTVTMRDGSVHIYSFLIYNRRSPKKSYCCEHRLIGFKLEALAPGSSAAYTYRDPRTGFENIYTIVPSPRIDQAISAVRIQKSSKSRFLTLCEVFVFGERVCPSGKFGLECDRDCNCVGDLPCFIHSGGCPAGCKPGYTGEDCKSACPRGTYGLGCSKKCSIHCYGTHDPCNHVDGHCDKGCDPGYQNAKCDTECNVGYHGQNCKYSCNHNCMNQSCNNIDGKCGECVPGYTGDFCDNNCSTGMYGQGCQLRCPANCVDQQCNHTDGKCGECVPGYVGEFCDQTDLKQTHEEASENQFWTVDVQLTWTYQKANKKN